MQLEYLKLISIKKPLLSSISISFINVVFDYDTMLDKTELPSLESSDKESPNRLAELEDSYMRLKEILAEEQKNTIERFKELQRIKSDAFEKAGINPKKTVVIDRDDKEGIPAASMYARLLPGITKDVIKKVQEIDEKLRPAYKKVTEAKNSLNHIMTGEGMVLEAIVAEFTELKPIVEEGCNRAMLYVAQGEGLRVSQVILDLPKHDCSEMTTVLNLTYADFSKNPKATIDGSRMVEPNADIYLAYNPSKVVDLESVMNYGRELIWEKFMKRNPEAAKKAMEHKHNGQDILFKLFKGIFGGIIGINRDPLSSADEESGKDYNIPSEDKYRNGCPHCPAKDSCSNYQKAKRLYDKDKK